MRERRDLEYADRPTGPLHLDLYLPDEDPPHPLVVWVHGGGWREGDREFVEGGALRLPDRGYALASVEYRLTDVASFPAQIADCRAAVRWLRANAGEFGIDPDRVAAWGPSAGGHLVSLLGTAPDEPFGDGTESPESSHHVDAVIDFYGPTDLPGMVEDGSGVDPTDPDSAEAALLGAPLAERRERARRASPLSHVDGSEPPFLVAHGSEDGVVAREQSERFVSALADAGDDVTYHVVGGAGHEDFQDPTVDELVDGFLDRHLR